MKKLGVLAAVLVAVGALNWGLVAIARFNLAAAIFGMKFGEVSMLSPMVTGLSLWQASTKPRVSKPCNVAGVANRHFSGRASHVALSN